MSKTDKQPEYLTFRCPLTVEAAGEAGKQMPRFRMVAYTGGTMRIAGFPHPVVVDLEGLAIDRQDIPVRLDHKPHQGVGHTQRVAIENGQVVAEGLISRDTSWARDVAKSAVNGFPWQASIGAAVWTPSSCPTASASPSTEGRSPGRCTWSAGRPQGNLVRRQRRGHGHLGPDRRPEQGATVHGRQQRHHRRGGNAPERDANGRHRRVQQRAGQDPAQCGQIS
jgi:hypothetical protein